MDRKNVFNFHENNIIMQQINLKWSKKKIFVLLCKDFFFLFIMWSLKCDLAMISPSCPCNALFCSSPHLSRTQLLLFLQDRCRWSHCPPPRRFHRDGRLGVAWPVAVDRQSVLQRGCGCGGLGWSGGGWCGCGGPAAGEGPSGDGLAERGKCRSRRERSGSGSCDWRYSGRGGGEERNRWKA